MNRRLLDRVPVILNILAIVVVNLRKRVRILGRIGDRP